MGDGHKMVKGGGGVLLWLDLWDALLKTIHGFTRVLYLL